MRERLGMLLWVGGSAVAAAVVGGALLWDMNRAQPGVLDRAEAIAGGAAEAARAGGSAYRALRGLGDRAPR